MCLSFVIWAIAVAINDYFDIWVKQQAKISEWGLGTNSPNKSRYYFTVQATYALSKTALPPHPNTSIGIREQALRHTRSAQIQVNRSTTLDTSGKKISSNAKQKSLVLRHVYNYHQSWWSRDKNIIIIRFGMSSVSGTEVSNSTTGGRPPHQIIWWTRDTTYYGENFQFQQFRLYYLSPSHVHSG